MAVAVQLSYSVIGCPNFNPDNKCLGFSRHLNNCHKITFFFSNADPRRRRKVQFQRLGPSTSTCSASNKPEISSTAKIRGEVLSPFRSVRMFFYLAFFASGALGGLIATTQLIAALSNPSRAAEVPDILNGLGIDIGAVSIFAFLYYRENTKNAQLAKLSREESLSNLRIRVDQKRIVPVSDFRGIARLVILAGPASFIAESFKSSEPFTDRLVERGVLVVPFASYGSSPSFEFEDSEELKEITAKRKGSGCWLRFMPLNGLSKWLEEQKNLAGVSPESAVYLSLRLDGRVRGSGVGYPPWNAFVTQLPPLKGMWSGLLDGMDGRVL